MARGDVTCGTSRAQAEFSIRGFLFVHDRQKMTTVADICGLQFVTS